MTTYEKGKHPVDDLANTLQDERLPLREKKNSLSRALPFCFYVHSCDKTRTKLKIL